MGYLQEAAKESDLERIIEIEKLSFAHPWPKQSFEEELTHDLSRFFVLRDEDSDIVVAFLNYWIVKDEVHIMNIATHPDWRRKGLARVMLNNLLKSCIALKVILVTLEVRRTNTPAKKLYESYGFEILGVRPKYYQDNEDAIIMVLDL